MGIYHNVDDFNFEVTNFHFPDSNIYSRITHDDSFYYQLSIPACSLMTLKTFIFFTMLKIQ